MDKKIISAVYKDRGSYERIKGYIDKAPDQVLTDLNVVLYQQAKKFYDGDEHAPYVDFDVVESYIHRAYPKQEEVLGLALKRIREEEVPSTLNIIKEFIEAKKYSIGLKLSTALIHNSPADELLDEYLSLSSEESLDTSDVHVYENIRIGDVQSALDPSNRIQLYPQELNDRCRGGALRGHHILVFARPEVGKSLVALNMARGFIEQGLRVLYVGNEDPAESMITRFMCCLLGMDEDSLMSLGEDESNNLLQQAGIDNFVFVPLSPGTPDDIRGLTMRKGADVIIIDQLRNLNSHSDGLVQKLETVAKEVRNIGQKLNALVVSVTQAGDSASEKLVLTMSDVDSSKTGIPAQVDLMVGVGMDEEYRARGKRMFSLSKNKLGGEKGFFSVTVDEKTSRIV